MDAQSWKIVGKDGVELIQCSLEENRVSVRIGPPTGFMTQSAEPPEAPVIFPNRQVAEAMAIVLKQTTIEHFKSPKIMRVTR